MASISSNSLNSYYASKAASQQAAARQKQAAQAQNKPKGVASSASETAPVKEPKKGVVGTVATVQRLADGIQISRDGDKTTVIGKDGKEIKGATVKFDEATGNFTIKTGGNFGSSWGTNEINTTYTKDGKIVTKEFSSSSGTKIVLQGDKNGQLSSINNATYISKDGTKVNLSNVKYDQAKENISFSIGSNTYVYSQSAEIFLVNGKQGHTEIPKAHITQSLAKTQVNTYLSSKAAAQLAANAAKEAAKKAAQLAYQQQMQAKYAGRPTDN